MARFSKLQGRHTGSVAFRPIGISGTHNIFGSHISSRAILRLKGPFGLPDQGPGLPRLTVSGQSSGYVLKGRS